MGRRELLLSGVLSLSEEYAKGEVAIRTVICTR